MLQNKSTYTCDPAHGLRYVVYFDPWTFMQRLQKINSVEVEQPPIMKKNIITIKIMFQVFFLP